MDETSLRDWFAANRRDLPVRAAGSPWSILVVEVMSQQTRIDRIAPYWEAFVGRWPSPAALAGASTRELLDAWAGLGYNRRALALREAARTVVERHGGAVPATVGELEALPGIGPYTARAIAAAAFDRAVAPLDVNVRRVVSRFLGGRPSPRALQVQADGLVWRDDPRAWVEATMDLAATVCLPRAPRCDACPLAPECRSRGRVESEARRREPAPFRTTRRWLRGELVRRLRAVPHGEWVGLEGPVGVHPASAVRETLAALESEGFLERQADRYRLHTG